MTTGITDLDRRKWTGRSHRGPHASNDDGPPFGALLPAMIVNVAVASLAIFAMRGIYFALLEEGGIPLVVTGTATGIISVIGYTPDIFMPLLGGVLLDRYPGPEGYRLFFLTVAGICTIGLVATLLLYRKIAARED